MINRRDFVRLSAITAALGNLGSEISAQGELNGLETRKPVNQNEEPPRLYRKFDWLPPGSVLPRGWLEEYCHINAYGWVLKQAKDRLPEVWGRYVYRTSNPNLGFTANDEWIDPPDYGAYFGEALVHYGILKAGAEVETEANAWVTQLLESQDSDGYIGAFTPKARWQCWLEIFHQSLLMDTLLDLYEANQDDARLLNASERAADCMMRAWYEPNKLLKPEIFLGHGAVIVRTMGKLYSATGKAKYRVFGRLILDRFGKTKAYLSGRNHVVHEHDAIASENIGLPAAVYEYTGDPELLKASKAAWEMMIPYLSVDGSPHGDEMIFRTGSRMNCEHCGAVEWMITLRDMARITGEVKYADAVERAMFNGYPAPKAPDAMSLAYMHSPNQLVATEWSLPHDNDGDEDYWASRQYFSTAHEPLCCNSNGPRAIPFYIESMIQRAGDGLVFSYYGPCHAFAKLPSAGEVEIIADTKYPFEDEVRFILKTRHSTLFPLRFRIPTWCQSAGIEVNGNRCNVTTKPGTYATVQNSWKTGDEIRLRFVNPIVVNLRRKSEFNIRARTAIVQRGPLVFSLPVEADFRRFPPPAHGPGKDIKAYRLFPKQGVVWNYAYALDPIRPERSLTFKRLDVPGGSRPWDSRPPIGLEVKARRILNWHIAGQPDYPRTPSLPLNPLRLATEEETVMLVPFGCTRLRITYLPLVPGNDEDLAEVNRMQSFCS